MSAVALHRSSAIAPPDAYADASSVVLERLPVLDRVAPIDAAEAIRDLPGMALLESARPGRRSRWTYLTADPVAVVERPAPGRDPFASARRLLARMTGGPARPGVTAPPFTAGLVGYVGYDLGRELERLPAIALDDQPLPRLRLALHDWVIAWDRSEGTAWIVGRAVDGDVAGLRRRLADVRARMVPAAFGGRPGARGPEPPGEFTSGLSRDRYEEAVESVRAAIERGDIYQANLTRRLEAPFSGDPWPLYRLLRTGDPALYAAYLDLGVGDAPLAADGADAGVPADAAAAAGPRAILSASPESFLAVRPGGVVLADPIKGTRPRGRDRAEDRALAADLLASPKDRAENVMIVDVLRNDLGRVCRPGSVRVPRLCRLERTAAVQHLVSTVTGLLREDTDPFGLLAAAFPGGSITGAPKIRAMEIVESLEPVRRGPYTGALGWLGPDGTMATSILIRTFVADGRRLTLHVGGGITHRSDPAAEWKETVAKASGPLRALGARER